MNFGKIADNINIGVKKLSRELNKHSREILVGCGIVGFISTSVMVAKRAPEAKERLDDLHDRLGEIDEDLSKGKIIFEEIKAVAPVYAAPVFTGAVSTACIIGAYTIGSRRTAALATAYELSQATLFDYKNKVVEALGEKKEAKISNDIAQDRVNSNPPAPSYTSTEVVMTDGLSLFYDSYGGRYFRSSVELVRKAEKAISERLINEMWCPLNEFYYELGLSNTKMGDSIGFNVDDGIDIIFNSVVAPDMTPCMVIDYFCAPRFDYDGSRRHYY